MYLDKVTYLDFDHQCRVSGREASTYLFPQNDLESQTEEEDENGISSENSLIVSTKKC